jgi:prepilin-type N-terminal cleavage/methylation domain-containing protein/prepilin-type processing-associated H-X9-DG protein
MKTQRKVWGFTLIELLVVIAIISTLAAILMPVFAAAREKGRTASCSSNLRQLAQAIQMYTDDHDGYYPIIGRWDSPRPDMNMCRIENNGKDPNNMDILWFNSTQPYIKNKEILRCPSDTRKVNCQSINISYAMNQLFTDIDRWLGIPCPNWPYNAIKASRVTSPSDTILVFDFPLSAVWDDTNGLKSPGPTRLWDDMHLFPKRHTDGANFAFTDGHVKWVKRYTPLHWSITY